MKKTLSLLTAAALTAASFSVCAYAEGYDSKELEAELALVKSRIDIPEELSEFRYSVGTYGISDRYNFVWSTPSDAMEYRSISCTAVGGVITSYYDTSVNGYSDEYTLAELSGDELYSSAKSGLKALDPTVYSSIEIDRDSLVISMRRNTAVFSVVRTKNGIPVGNDSGRITVDKNTGKLIGFDIGWHEKAAFKDPGGVLGIEKAKQAYADMIDIEPVYEIYYDYESRDYKTRLVYVQTQYGDINAFTGKRSDFASDGYYGGEMNDSASEADKEEAAPGAGSFTPQEIAEITKELPYASAEAAEELLDSNRYLHFCDCMELSYSNLRKSTVNGKDTYYYTVSFQSDTSEFEYDLYEYDGVFEKSDHGYESVRVTLNAETGEIISYSYYDGGAENGTLQYDMAKADSLAKEIAQSFAGERFGEFGGYSSSEWSYNTYNQKLIYGSSHSWNRYSDDIRVSGNYINVGFNSAMVLTDYNISYTEAELPSPKGMLTKQQAMSSFWKTAQLKLNYLARAEKTRTATVLVYSADRTLYCDAFTGEPVYSYYNRLSNDLSGITDKALAKKAQILSDHGLYISSSRFKGSDAVKFEDFTYMLSSIANYGVIDSGESSDGSGTLTRGKAVVLFTSAVCGTQIPSLAGIYKSPFSDVKDSDENVGYYAIAYALGAVSGNRLEPDKAFTFADMIEMAYGYLSK